MNEQLKQQIEQMLEAEKKNSEVNKLRAKTSILNQLGVKYTIVVKEEDAGEHLDVIKKVLEW